VEIQYSETNEFTNKKPVLNTNKTVFLEDKNDKQIIEVEILNCQTIKLLIKSFYDLYGRVIIYDLKFLGKKVD
jgi:hypothetical protein